MPPAGAPPPYPPSGSPSLPPASSAPSWAAGGGAATGNPPQYPGMGGAAPSTEPWGPVDAGSMRWILLAAILGFVAYAVTIALPAIMGIALSNLNTTGLHAFSTTVVSALIAVAAVAGAFSALQYFLYGRAFAALAPNDRRFRTPARLSWVAIAGVIIAIGAVAWVLYLFGGIVSCAAGVVPIPSSCISPYTGRLIGAAGIALLGALLTLIGLIGIWLGLWRLGTRYDAVLFKVGMVLSIFPYINLVGYILIIIAAWGVRQRAMARSAPGAA